MNIRELRQRRAACMEEAKVLLEKQDFSDDDKAKVDSLFSEADAIDRKLELAERTTARGENRRRETTGRAHPAMVFRDKRTGEEISSLAPGETFSDRFPNPEQMRLGPIVAAMATGDRSRLTEAERRAMSEGTSSAGGFLVPAPISSRVYDIMRSRSSVFRAGPTVVPMTSNTLDLIKVSTGPSASWLAENSQGSAGDLVLARVQLNAQTLASYAVASLELMQDSDPSLTGVLEMSMAGAMAVELDRAALAGSGSGAEPLGLLISGSISNYSNSNAKASYAMLSQAISVVQGNNHEPNAAIITSRDAGVLDRLVDTTGQPLFPSPLVQRIMDAGGFIVSNQYPQEAGSPGISRALVGDFQYCVLGVRQELVIELSNTAVTGSDSAWDKRQIHIRALLRADVGIVLPNAFCAIGQIAPA